MNKHGDRQFDSGVTGRNEGVPLQGVSAHLRVHDFGQRSGRACVLRFAIMELNQIKRFIKDLEERTDSLRRYL